MKRDTSREVIRLGGLINESGVRDQLGFDRLGMLSMVTHSTAIEGSTLTETENQVLFEDGVAPAGKTVGELNMNLDLKKAYETGFQMADSKVSYSVPMLKALSAVVMHGTGSLYHAAAGTFDSSRGELRLVNVSAGRGGRSYVRWEKVPDLLAEFCDWVNDRRKATDLADVPAWYDLSFAAHFRLVTIHPWVDGNGRMSRLVMNMVQREAGLLPSVLAVQSKADYIDALNRSRDEHDEGAFIEFMAQELVRQMNATLSDYERSLEAYDMFVDGQPDVDDAIEKVEQGDAVGRRPGRRPADHETVASALRLYREGEMTVKDICDRYGISKSTLYRYLGEHPNSTPQNKPKGPHRSH